MPDNTKVVVNLMKKFSLDPEDVDDMVQTMTGAWAKRAARAAQATGGSWSFATGWIDTNRPSHFIASGAYRHGVKKRRRARALSSVPGRMS